MVSTVIQILPLLIILVLVAPVAAANPINFKTYPAFFNLGDSNSDTGNSVAAYIQGNLPSSYGRTYFHQPSGRASDGRLILDFLMNATGLPFLNPYLEAIGLPDFKRGCNFAVGGSTIAKATITALSPFSFKVQVGQLIRFKTIVLKIENQTRALDNYFPAPDYFHKGLYMSDIGQNDLAGFLDANKTMDEIAPGITRVLGVFEDNIKVLYNLAGARNFWIHNTGPIGCLPAYIAKVGKNSSRFDELGCVVTHNQAARLFNLQLQALCKKLKSQYPHANVTYVDIFSIKLDLIANYSRYGFEQPITACITSTVCNDPNKHVNWDGIHYTEAANRHVASYILSGNYSSEIP